MTLLLVQLAATWFMTGLIWFVQVVHYPLFDAVGASSSTAYATAHQRRTTWVVGPVMLVEALTACIVAVRPPDGIPPWMGWLGLGLLAVIWASTALLQVPEHGRLARGHDAPAIRRLVASNWIRTIGWTTRGALASVMLVIARHPTP